MSISAKTVKELRDKTAAGMMDCKKALEETGGDVEKAVDWLRQKGLSKAAKKAGRATSEGLIGCEVSADNKQAVLVEVRCETDFVSRGDNFQDFVKATVASFNASGLDAIDEAATAESLSNAIATLGENIVIGKSYRLNVAANGLIGSYVHSNGKIAALVELTCTKAETETTPEFVELAKNIAMQIAAASPVSVSSESIDPEILERERDVYRQKARDEGKKEELVEKIAEGAIKKYFKEVCLLEQGYIRDDKSTIADLVAACAKTVGDTITVKGFVRIQLGAE